MPSPGSGRSVRWIEVETTDELRDALAAEAVTRVALYRRDALDDGHVHGGLKPTADITSDDLQWLLESDPYESRFLLCERRVG
jgi:hypothetical protein